MSRTGLHPTQLGTDRLSFCCQADRPPTPGADLRWVSQCTLQRGVLRGVAVVTAGVTCPAQTQTSRKRRIAMAEPMEPMAAPAMTTTTLVSKTSDPDMCIAVKMLLVVRPLPSWLMKR
jgi:hypothetical protein